MESIPERKEIGMIDNEIVDQVRTAVIKDLEEAIQIYSANGTIKWLGEQKAREFIQMLQNKLPVVFLAGEMWEGSLQRAIVDGQGIGHDDPRYKELKRIITEGGVS